MSHVAIIACDHGLGHVRRCYLVAQELLHSGANVDLYAPKAKINRVREVLGEARGLKIHDFSTNTTPDNLQSGSVHTLQWPERLPNLDRYSFIISDSLPELLEYRPDAILLAHFFWHDVLDDLPPSYVDRCEELLHIHQPMICGSERFSMEVVRGQPAFRNVGLYGPSRTRLERIKGSNNILLSPGSTQRAHNAFDNLIRIITRSDSAPNGLVYVDPEVLPRDCPEWMRPFDYSPAAYKRISAAVCRPGLGILTDALWYGVLPICFTADRNREMMHNARVIRNHSLGYHCQTGGEVLQVLSGMRANPSSRPQLRRLPTSEFSASAQIASLIVNHPGH